MTLNPLANDWNGGKLSQVITGLGEARHGEAELLVNGKVSYRPDEGFSGFDSFSYTITDAQGHRSTSKVTVQVLPETLNIAVIGDYGLPSAAERAVANLVKSWKPDAIVTLGDNVYGVGTGYDAAVGRYYSAYIGNYKGEYGLGSAVNRFFPALGNHDYFDASLKEYEDYFTLPKQSSGNERYYSVRLGSVELFFLNNTPYEPDGVTASSKQGQWLKAGLAASKAQWQFVISPAPPHSSGAVHGPETSARWPYEKWGADAVLSGDEHVFERFLFDGNGDGVALPYFVNGLGGASIYDFNEDTAPGSVARYNDDFGAMLITLNAQEASFYFYSIADPQTPVDSFSLFMA